MRIFNRYLKLLSLFTLLYLSLFSVESVFAFDTSTRIFDPRFQTIRLTREENQLLPPVISLNGSDRLILSFDEIGDDFSDDIQYSLTHCNSDWQPSRLLESEYLDGFNFADIEDYAFSSNTFIHYVNYRAVIPAPDMKFKMSGNYLLRVFRRGDPDRTLLQVRFSVTEQKAAISGQASGRTDRGINTNFQQLNFIVNTSRETVANPLSDLIVTVTQNSRPETRRLIPRPLRTDGNSLVYQSIPELIFNAGNEYRRFETVRNNYPGIGVDSTRFSGSCYHAWITPAFSRADAEYSFDSTQHGRFVIDEYNSTDPDLGADYIMVHFALDFPEIPGAEIFLEGDFTNRRFDERNKMKYNPLSGLYELTLPLKQGSYNYQYVVKSSHGNTITFSPSPIEGDYADTSNEYTIEVYLRTPASRGDRLLGSATLFSNP